MVDRKELVYKFKGNTSDVDFSKYYGATDLINETKKNGYISLKKAVDDQYNFKTELGDVKKGNPKRKSKTNLKVIENADNLYNSRQAAVNFSLNILKEFQKQNLDQNKEEHDLRY